MLSPGCAAMPLFVQRGENHIHEDNGQAESDEKLAEGSFEFTATAGHHSGISGGHIQIAGSFDDRLVAIRQSISRRHRCLQGHLALTVEPVDLRYALG